MDNKILTIGAIILIVFVAVWYVAVVPEVEMMPEMFENSIHYQRISNTNHKIGGEWTGDILVKGSTIEKTIRNEGNTLILKGNYRAEGLNNEVLWEVNKEYGIDRITRKTVEGYGQYADNSYYKFPPTLRKQNYNIWIAQYLYPIKLDFIGIEYIKNLEVYHFEAKNFIFDDSEGFAWLDFVPEKYNVLTDGTVNIWVEPQTGIIIDFKGGGVAYYADKGNNNKIQDMQTWSNKYTNDTITSQVLKAQNEKFKLLLVRVILPLLVAILIIVITVLVSLKGKKHDK